MGDVVLDVAVSEGKTAEGVWQRSYVDREVGDG